VAADRSHHLLGETPLYAARFAEVLSFHAPGLAAARDSSGAFHIGLSGSAAYARRFARTFGFYEGLAAVQDESGAFHIHPDGTELTPERYAWCGNFQDGRCTVRARDGRYLHIDREGRPAYAERYAYAGDFRDGVAVVQEDSGPHLHIHRDGRPLNGRRFLDLDVFHKGYARARGMEGWHHVDTTGAPLYARRFAAAEPFYNGQARVEQADGALWVIDEQGRNLRQLRPPRHSALQTLSGDMVGFWRTQALHAAVELRVVEALPATAAQVASSRGLVPERCERLLRALGELGLVEREGDAWRVKERGALLHPEHPLSLADAALHWGHDCYPLWEALPEAMRAEGAWAPPRFFDMLAKNPLRLASYHRAMESYARHDYARIAEVLSELERGTVLDAGGGTGALLKLLLQARPALRGILFERPEVIQAVEVPEALAGRLEVRPGNLFEPWGARAEAVILARVLHDWDNAAALRILAQARAVLAPGNRLYILDRLLGREELGGSLLDVHMLVTTGGQERSQMEFEALLTHVGFQLRECRPLSQASQVLVAEAV
jgi:SAM-dependent methyltransferase